MPSDFQSLLEEIQDRVEAAKADIAQAGMAGEWQHARQIADAAKALESVHTRLVEVRRDFRKAIGDLDELTKTHTKAPQTRLMIRINWRLVGKEMPDTLVDEPTGAEAMAKFLEVLVETNGLEILDHVQRIPCGGSGLVSKNPRLDFINPANGEEYGSRPVGRTGWHVKTHTSTKTKVEQIHQIKAMLGLPRQMVEAEILEK